MINRNKIRSNILELCSEDAYGSWEFWSSSEGKTEEQAIEIVDTLAELVNAGELNCLKYNSTDNTYTPTVLNKGKLRKELLASMQQVENPGVINSDEFYWFESTDKGKEEDRLARS